MMGKPNEPGVQRQRQMRDKLYDILFTTATEAMLVVNESGEIVEVNVAGEALTGYPYAVLLTLSLSDLFTGGTLPTRRSEGNPLPDKVELRQENGRSLAVNITPHLLTDGYCLLIVRPSTTQQPVLQPEHAPLLMLPGLAHSTSGRNRMEEALRESEEYLHLAYEAADKRRQAEQALRASEARYHSTLDNMLEGCQIIGFDWRYLYMNASVTHHSRRSKEDLLGRTMMEIYPGIENTELFAMLRRCMIERIPDRLENEFFYDDGSSAWFDLSIQPVPEGLFILSVDITERKQAEAMVAQLNRRMELILHSAGEGIYGTDVNGRITFMNPAMAHMLDWEAADLLGQNAHDIFHHTRPDGRAYPADECVIRHAMHMGREYHTDRELYWRKDGTGFPVECTCAPIREGGQIVGMVVVVKDVTERQQQAARQAKLEEQLRQAQKMESIGRLAGGVAHDFNNQLTIIQIYSDLMRLEMDVDSSLLSHLEQIQQASGHASSLTRQLLAFSRKQILQPAILNLNDLVANLKKMLARLIGEDITLITVLPADLWPVRADPGQIEQVIMNLVVNARDAMPTGGQLLIETGNFLFDEVITNDHLDALSGPCVMLVVSDTGHGMDEATKSQIFEPFFTTKRKGEGTGLGLATVHGIVKQSGGAIFVYSEPGQGTTFKVYLPSSQNEAVQEATRRLFDPSQGGHETILLVEDEAALRELIRITLEERGYTVLEAENGRHALLLAEQYPAHIDLLLTDVVLPQMSGGEVAQRLKTDRPKMKVLYTSGYMDDAVVRHGLLTAKMEFLPKPFTRHYLTSKVREVLDTDEI